MNTEISAGTIVFRQHPTRHYLLLDYGSHWDFPKGHIEPGEAPEVTARRELLEETGIAEALFVPGYRAQIRYWYRRAGTRMQKDAIFFLAEAGSDAVSLSREHCGYLWLSYDAALRRLTFKSARNLLAAAEQLLNGAVPKGQ
jgi:8-oxo-dGTP pyrophosphatase MutT (NUDIX family)